MCDCGKEIETLKANLIYGSTKSCGCLSIELLSNRTWKGCGDISGRYLGMLKKTARKRGIEYNISNEYLWKLFIEQEGKCALTGHKIIFTRNFRNEDIKQTASLDRIDSSKGYVEGNVWWVHKDINQMKWSFTLDIFYKMCEDVINFRNKADNDRLKG